MQFEPEDDCCLNSQNYGWAVLCWLVIGIVALTSYL